MHCQGTCVLIFSNSLPLICETGPATPSQTPAKHSTPATVTQLQALHSQSRMLSPVLVLDEHCVSAQESPEIRYPHSTAFASNPSSLLV